MPAAGRPRMPAPRTAFAPARPLPELAALPPVAAPPEPTVPERREGPAWDGGTCLVSGRVTLQPAPGTRAPAGVVVFLEGVPSTHFRRPPPVKHQVRQLNRQFVPPLLVIQRRDTVDFYNDDQERHQVFTSDSNASFDIPSTTRSLSGSHRFLAAGAVRLLCNIHPRMRADLLVLDNPLWTQAALDGSWQLEAPPGRWRVVAWEPNGGRAERTVEVCGAAPVELPLPQAEEPLVRRKGGPPAPEYAQ